MFLIIQLGKRRFELTTEPPNFSERGGYLKPLFKLYQLRLFYFEFN